MDWEAVREDWTIVADGKKTTESYDYTQEPSEDFAYLMLYHPSFYIFSSNPTSEEKSLTMVYSDRFSPIVAGTTKPSATTMSVRVKRDEIIGSGDVVLTVVSVDREEMVIDYDSGEVASEGGGTSSGTGGTVQRKCRFVFERVK